MVVLFSSNVCDPHCDSLAFDGKGDDPRMPWLFSCNKLVSVFASDIELDIDSGSSLSEIESTK